MLDGLIGKKVGMTQIFDENGNVVPVTVIQAGPCVVVQRKTPDKDGYSALQVGLVEPGRKFQANRPREGHFKKSGVPPVRVLREFGFQEENEEKPVQPGDQVLAGDVFQVNDRVHVSGRAKGKGFQGVVRRHGFHGGRATHGSMFHRAPGSIGASAFPSRVLKGMKAPGRMGGNQVTVKKLRVVQVDSENNLLLVEGAVPGSRGGYVSITRAR